MKNAVQPHDEDEDEDENEVEDEDKDKKKKEEKAKPKVERNTEDEEEKEDAIKEEDDPKPDVSLHFYQVFGSIFFKVNRQSNIINETNNLSTYDHSLKSMILFELSA